MPELPEVETIRLSLKFLEGREIQKTSFSNLAPIETTNRRNLRKLLQNTQLQNLDRKGKYLMFRTAKGSLVLHLGMSGKLDYAPAGESRQDKHIHMRIDFSDGGKLYYIDARRFGTLSLSRTSDGQDNPFLDRLGPDYIDENFSEEAFLTRCRRHPGLNLKALALHQGIAAGLGNIYACETLYYAELDPRRRVEKTSDQALKKLHRAARRALNLGIQHGGSSLRDYVDGLGNRGVMKNFLQVYGREGQTTLDGRGQVQRITQQARSTWFSPQVQK